VLGILHVLHPGRYVLGKEVGLILSQQLARKTDSLLIHTFVFSVIN
jgi:hypothetical protein